MKRHAAIVLVVLLGCLWVMAALAADPVGELLVERGMVKLRRLDREQVIRASPERVALMVGDALQSAPESRATLTFHNRDQTVSLYSNTFFQVDDVKPSRSLFRLVVGKALFAVLRLTGEQSFGVRTPTATIGVKGTEFVLGSDGVDKTFLLTVEGLVSMISNAMPDVEVVVGKDQASFVSKGQPPTPPVEVTPEARENIKQEDSLKTFEAIEAETPVTSEEGKKKEEKAEQTPLEQVVDQVQETQEAVQAAVESALSNCPSDSGCGKLRFGW